MEEDEEERNGGERGERRHVGVETDVFILALSSDAVAVTCIVVIVAGEGQWTLHPGPSLQQSCKGRCQNTSHMTLNFKIYSGHAHPDPSWQPSDRKACVSSHFLPREGCENHHHHHFLHGNLDGMFIRLLQTPPRLQSRSRAALSDWKSEAPCCVSAIVALVWPAVKPRASSPSQSEREFTYRNTALVWALGAPSGRI